MTFILFLFLFFDYGGNMILEMMQRMSNRFGVSWYMKFVFSVQRYHEIFSAAPVCSVDPRDKCAKGAQI